MNYNKPKATFYYITIILFIAAMVWGYIQLRRQVAAGSELDNIFSSYNFFRNLSPFWLFIFIFLNNAIKAFFTIILGIFLGIFPLYFIYVNGVLLGATIAFALYRANLWVLLAGLLPHGIFELPALIIAITFGLWLGFKFLQSFKTKEPMGPIFRQSLGVYIRVVVPLLLIGAIIEAFVTPVLLNAALKTIQ